MPLTFYLLSGQISVYAPELQLNPILELDRY